MLPPGHSPRGGIAGLSAFEHPLVVDGLLAGYWTRRTSGAKTHVEIKPWKPLTAPQRKAVTQAAERLKAFSGEGMSLRP
jgi:hypothetical protein